MSESKTDFKARSHTASHSAQGRAGLSVLEKAYRRIVLAALSAMNSGRLKLVLPEGEVLYFGAESRNSDTAVSAEIIVRDEIFFRRLIYFGHVGLSESFMDGDWTTKDVAGVIAWALLNVNDCQILEGNKGWRSFNFFGTANQILHYFRRNHESSSRRNISYHYDLSNDLFKLFLDQSMTYSSAYFKNWNLTLKQAQDAKYENLCQKLLLKSTDQVLEIGCGWGGFAEYAARNYGCQITAVTISQEQFDFAKTRLAACGLSERVDLRLQDYRKIGGQFDKIVSIEMIEAVGHEYLDVFFNQCNLLLKKDGLLALQMITCPDSRYDLLRQNTDFIQKHVFPGSQLLSHRRVSQALERTQSDLFLHELEDIGNYYAKTLEIWQTEFESHLEQVHSLGFDQTFVRKWQYYLSYCFAAFAMRNITAVQAVYTRPNNLNLSHTDLLRRLA